MSNERILMLDLYKSVFHFAECLRCADAASETKAEMHFIMQMRYRHIRKHLRMRMTMLEYQRLLALAIEGGWDGSPINADELMGEPA